MITPKPENNQSEQAQFNLGHKNIQYTNGDIVSDGLAGSTSSCVPVFWRGRQGWFLFDRMVTKTNCSYLLPHID